MVMKKSELRQIIKEEIINESLQFTPEEEKMLIRILNNQLDVYNDFEDKWYTEEIGLVKQILMKVQ
tara:strand:+ start:2579 stop:2776 length:198 start_codon:yes stop_codon:yes gene_type:complete